MITFLDLILRVLLCNFLLKYLLGLPDKLVHLNKHVIRYLNDMLMWLMTWPAGLKLNSFLSKFLGELFLWMLDTWSFISEERILYLVLGLASKVICLSLMVKGTRFTARLTSRMINVFTCHLTFFYLIASRLYRWQLAVLISLFHLFRGKRWNVLRCRLDSTTYALDQLLLGTVLFCIMGFCFPTVAAYYVLFLVCRLTILVVRLPFDMIASGRFEISALPALREVVSGRFIQRLNA